MPGQSFDEAMASAHTPGNAVANLQSDVNNYSPLAVHLYSQPAPAPTPHFTPNKTSTPNQGIIPGAFHFIGGVGSEIGSLTEKAASWLGSTIVQTGQSLYKFPQNLVSDTHDYFNLQTANTQIDQATNQLHMVQSEYAAGNISKEQYQNSLKTINQSFGNLTDQTTALNNRINTDAAATKQNGLNTISAVLALVTGGSSVLAGIGAKAATAAGTDAATSLLTKDAAEFLTSKATGALFKPTINKLQNFAISKALMSELPTVAQKAVQESVAEVVATGAKMSAPQIARAAAVNLALKAPITYWYTSTTANELYHELDNAKYGDAVQTLALNAAMLLSGGPIGYALKWGGKAVSASAARVFARSAFIDELSKGIGNGAADGIINEVSNIKNPGKFRFLVDGNLVTLPAEEIQKRIVNNLSAVELTNMKAAGSDPVAAAWRVLKGMAGYEGVDMKNFTHEEALTNMSNFAEAQRAADEAGKAIGQRLTVGRVDVRSKSMISAALNPSEDLTAADRLQLWENLKNQNPDEVWAHNENFDRQIKGLINKYEDSGQLDTAIRNIKAQTEVKGIPKNLTKSLGDMGYIAIEPGKLEAPFQEGVGKVASSFAGKNNDLFLKSVQPVPVLNWLGGAMTGAGLSPFSSSERVYQIFNDNLAKSLQDSGVIRDIVGEDKNQTTDTLIKQLSSYMHDPTHGRLAHNIPLTDLRMLTTKDTMAATGMGAVDSKLIQRGIARSYLQVPLAVRGLGDRAVDLTYKKGVGVISRRYLRIQGALKFSWNPFFQYLRLIPKTETLTEFEGGGFIRSLFAGRFKELKGIRSQLRENGLLDEKGQIGDVVSGEAVDFAGSTGRNLSHKLLPAQENSIAGLIDSQAQRMGMSSKDYINSYHDQVKDTIQAIAGYDRNSQLLNSPLMRTLNVAVFPLRFDTKVAGIMAKSLGRSSLITQVAVIKGLMDAHAWLNTNEGKSWYASNADMIGLFKYLSPVASMNEIFHSLIPGNDHSLGNFGELGGLPFGWIPQILDAEGLTQFNQAGANPKTGALYKNYIPSSAKGQLAASIQDFISSLFSYPGATVGLPSKTKFTSDIANSLVGATTKNDFAIKQPTPSPEQLSYQQAVEQGATQQANPAVLPSDKTVTSIKVPTLPTSVTTPKPPRIKSSTRKPRAKKKSDFRPQLLPGQTQLGQIQ